ncbi:PAS domain S-box protein [Fulvivirga ulvae]|uniref:PAS domain-containing sensor histidine kinase n=1 Tax=Fulvivirga ulvae TaxID=2904245 RepID=UPI001F2584D3|nr:PAS domain S-box protein [Fulvivirga ulvae]UII33365.1 PAS domain S-box protein [Fulvivirga ulvae]
MKGDNENPISSLAQKCPEISSLKDQLHKYEAAANGANDGLWDWDFENNVAFVSIPWKTMLGFDEDEAISYKGLLSWENLLHPDDKERAINTFRAYIDGLTENYREIFRLKHKDGTYRWILSKAKIIHDHNGKAVRISGSHTDITEQKKAADALKKSEEKYRNLFQNSLVAMLRSDSENGKIIEANEKFWQMLGVNKDKDYQLNFDFFYDDKEKRRVLGLLKEHGAVDNLELQIKTVTGQLIWVSFSAVLYADEQVFECVLKDITQTKENLLELQKVNFELDSFVYHASHDLRSPLRSVLGLIDLYRMEQSQPIKKECIDKIESSVKRLDDLVVELLSISRNDRVNDQHVPINLMVEINSSISSYYNATDTKGLEVITRVAQPILFHSDLTRVRIILNNLISNAIKYRSFHKERSYVLVEAKVTNGKAVIKVEDNGDGIEESKLPHIFDMFYRATEKSEGSGLGLYIVKKVADKLNAEIEVNSEELEGTTFIVTIPNVKQI